MRIFSLKSCDTCRKALRALREAGWSPVVTDVRLDGLLEDEIGQILDQFGEQAVNRASTTWRQLDEAARGKPLSELLMSHPTLLKRPVIVHDTWTLGWKADVQKHWLEDVKPGGEQ